MYGQTIHFTDLGTIGFLVILEALLSADNALVLAIMVRHLPREQQRLALLYGLGGAFVLRGTAILLTAFIIGFWWLQMIGALYLLFLPIKHFMSLRREEHHSSAKKMGFWKTVVYIELVDVAFALDSVLAAVAVVDTVRNPDKIWVVIAGAIIGIVVLRVAAGFFIRFLERYPVLDHVAYLLVGWAGVKLFTIALHSLDRWLIGRGTDMGFHVPEMPTWLFWSGMMAIAIVGTMIALKHEKKDLDPEEEEEARIVEETFGA